jgi:hypothetical protein
MAEGESAETAKIIAHLNVWFDGKGHFNEKMYDGIVFLVRDIQVSKSEDMLQVIQRFVCLMRAKKRDGRELGDKEIKAYCFIEQNLKIDRIGFVTIPS